MNAIVNKNTGKFLAAIMAIAMVVCCVSVLATSVNAEDSMPVYEVASNPSEEQYKDIPSAISAADTDGVTTFTVKLINDVTGAGFKAQSGQNITIDLNTHKYTINEFVGSTGTETNGMQLLQGSTVTIINGELSLATATNGWLIQNYSDLTVENVVVDGTNSGGYAMSNNCGNVLIKGETEIIAPEGGVAFDVCGYSSYPGVSVTIDDSFTGTINGKIEMTKDTGNTGGVGLEINADVEIENLDVKAGNVNIGEGATVTVQDATIAEGSTLTNNGSLVNNGTVTNNGTIMNNGEVRNNKTITNTGSLSNYGQIINGTDGKIDGEGSFIGNEATKRIGIDSTLVGLEGDLILDGEGFITGTGTTLTIPADKSIIIRGSGSLDLNGNTLIVEGKLVVETNGSVINLGGNNGGIVLAENGSIENAGVIGYGANPVKVYAIDTEGYDFVSIQNIEGLSFAIDKKYNSADEDYDYNLLISGDVYTATGNVSTYKFDIYGANVSGDLTVGTDIIVGGTSATVNKGSTFTVNGILACEVTMQNGSTLNVNGGANDAEIVAETGKFQTTAGYAGVEKTSVTLDDITGITLSVVSATSTEKDSSTQDDVSYTTQTLNVAGFPAFVGTATSGSITIDEGTSQIAADTTFVLQAGMTFNGNGIVVNGTIQYPVAPSGATVNGFVGTQYTVVDSANKTIKTGYVTTFDNALGVIDTAENKTINVYGDVTEKDGFTLASGQTIVLKSGSFVIDTDAKVTLENGSNITGQVNEVKGIMFAQKGAKYTVPLKYAVEGTNQKTGDKTYAGFEAAIANSAAGDEIKVIGKGYESTGVTVENDITIPADRTVINQTKLVFEGDLTIDEGAVFTNQNAIEMTGKKAVITVDGTLNSYDGKITYTDSQNPGNLYANGEYVVASTEAITGAEYYTVNGTYYANAEGRTVVTTFAKAVAAVGAMDGTQTVTSIGKTSESGEVTLAGDKAQIDGQVTLGTVTLDDAALTIGADGKLTATVIGAYGADGSTTDASVELSEAYAMELVNKSSTDAMNVTTWSNTMNAVNGTVTVSSGEIVFTGSGTVTADRNSVLTIASGATLIVDAANNGELVLGNADFLTVDGTVITKTDVEFGANATIAGTLDIRSGVTVADTFTLTVIGQVTVSADEDDDASFTIAGRLNIGATPKTLSASTTGSVAGTVVVTGNVVIYNGASAADAKFMNESETELNPTEFIVNEISYVTVYGTSNVDLLDSEIIGLKDIEDKDDEGNDITTIDWNADGEPITGSSTAIGKYAQVTTTLEWAGVPITVSAGPGLEIYIDNVYMNSGKTALTVGEHTITVYVKPDYEGTPTITLNGQAITGGTFTLTSDMIDGDNILYATGASPSDPTIVVDGGNGDDGLGLTDILLIILVILIVIMAIIVALRMMRS